MLDEESLAEQYYYWQSSTEGPTNEPLAAAVIERGMRGELEGKDANYYKLGENEKWEDLSKIERIVKLREEKGDRNADTK